MRRLWWNSWRGPFQIDIKDAVAAGDSSSLSSGQIEDMHTEIKISLERLGKVVEFLYEKGSLTEAEVLDIVGEFDHEFKD